MILLTPGKTLYEQAAYVLENDASVVTFFDQTIPENNDRLDNQVHGVAALYDEMKLVQAVMLARIRK